MFFFLLFIPSALLSLFMIFHLRKLKKHDSVLYSLCQVRRDVINYLWEHGQELNREEYITVRRLLHLLNKVINRYNTHKTILFNLRKILERTRNVESFSIQPMSFPDNDAVRCLYAKAFAAYFSGFLAYTPLIRSEYAVKFSLIVIDALTRIGVEKINSKMDNVLHTARKTVESIMTVHQQARVVDKTCCTDAGAQNL